MFERPARRRLPLLSAALLLSALPATARAQDWRSVTVGRSVDEETSMRVDVEYGIGSLDISKSAPGSLYRATLRYDAEKFEPVTDFRNNRLRLGIEGGTVRGHKAQGGSLRVALGPDVPLDLNLKFGASEAKIELGGLRVRRLEVGTGASVTQLNFATPNPETLDHMSFEVGAARFTATGLGNSNAQRLEVAGGVGEIELGFDGEWSQNMRASVGMGLGKLTLRLPRSLGVSIRKEGILSPLDSQGLIKRGDVYYSPNWEKAEHQLTLEVESALNSIHVVWLDASTN